MVRPSFPHIEVDSVLDTKLKCPLCHQELFMVVRSVIEDSAAHTAGGDSFRTNVSVNLKTRPFLGTIDHKCEIKKAD